MKKCGAPCEETSYDVRLTSLGEDRKEKERISFSVSVKFSSDSQKIFEYQPKLTVIEAFGYMGGYIGMWLGLSLYSLITDGEQWLRTFFTKRALKSSAAKIQVPKPEIFTTNKYNFGMSFHRATEASEIKSASPKVRLLRHF